MTPSPASGDRRLPNRTFDEPESQGFVDNGGGQRPSGSPGTRACDLLHIDHLDLLERLRAQDDVIWIRRHSEEKVWWLVVTEMGIDTRTPMGKAMAHMAVVSAELERDFIRRRTREALQVKKENGVTLGRPRSTPGDVVARIVRERTEGKTACAICPRPEQSCWPRRLVGANLLLNAGPGAFIGSHMATLEPCGYRTSACSEADLVACASRTDRVPRISSLEIC